MLKTEAGKVHPAFPPQPPERRRKRRGSEVVRAQRPPAAGGGITPTAPLYCTDTV